MGLSLLGTQAVERDLLLNSLAQALDAQPWMACKVDPNDPQRWV